MAEKGHEFFHNFDKKFKEGNNEEDFLDKGNNEMAEYFKKEATNLLRKVLYSASLKM